MIRSLSGTLRSTINYNYSQNNKEPIFKVVWGLIFRLSQHWFD